MVLPSVGKGTGIYLPHARIKTDCETTSHDSETAKTKKALEGSKSIK